MSGKPVNVAGVGMTPFRRPNSYKWDYPDMVKQSVFAGTAALEDAGLKYNQVQAVVCSYCYGESTCGQRAIYELGLTGVPVYNVNNNCSSASTALHLARMLIQSENFDCVMAVGFEKMEGGLTTKFEDREHPADRHFKRLEQLANNGQPIPPLRGMNRMTSEVIRMFALAAHEYMQTYPGALTKQDLANISIKNRRHGLLNENASFHKLKIPSLETVMSDRMLCDPITAHQSSMTADGSAAAVLTSESFDYNLTPEKRRRQIPILAQSLVTDTPATFQRGYKEVCGEEAARLAADQCYRSSGVGPDLVDVAEVHDCFSVNELLMYEALGFCEPGEAANWFRRGSWRQNARGGHFYRTGNVCVNPSGGLESKGHPIGATGLGQCHELVNQLRRECGVRQVSDCVVGLQHNFGIGSAAVVTMYGANVQKNRL